MSFIRIVILSFTLIVFSNITYADVESPDLIVKETVDGILLILDNESLSMEEKKFKVFDLVKQRINFKEMSRRIMAINWNKASDAQQEKFISLFEQILLNTYWTRIKRYSGERIEFTATSYDGGEYATVDTVILKEDNEVQVPITYRMKRFVDIWYAYDFIVEQLSLVQSYRNEYRATIKNLGIDGLLEQMQREIDNYSPK